MEDYEKRIDEAEAEFEAGLGLPSSEVFARLRKRVLQKEYVTVM